MNIIKTALFAITLSASTVALPLAETFAQDVTQNEKVYKTDLQQLLEIYAKETNKEKAESTYKRFLHVMEMVNAQQKNKLVESNNATAEVEKFDKLQVIGNKIVTANKANDKAEIQKGMEAFINAM